MYRKKGRGWTKHIDFMLLDVLCMQIAFIVSYIWRFGPGNPYTDKDYRILAAAFLLIDFFVEIVSDAFKNVLKRGYLDELIATCKHVVLVEILTTFFLFATQMGEIYSRMSYYIMIPIYILVSYLGRVVLKKIIKKRSFASSKKSLFVIAPEKLLEETLQGIKDNSFGYTQIVAAATDADLKGKTICEIPIVANHDGIVDYACEEWVDEVLIPPCAESEYPYEMADIFLEMGIAVHRGITKNKVMAGSFNQIEKIGDYTVITASMNYASTTQLLAKRGMDILGGLVGCIITLIVTIFVGPAIYIASPGPIFFAQERIGRNGRKFRMYKFRSMYMDAEERKKELAAQNKVSDGMMFKMDFDPRIIGNRILPDGTKKTGIGQFIRKTSIDELPQFWNILKGDMSLVGTRPPTLDEWEKYEPHHRARMSFRPGLTGLWQVSGRSNITDFEEVVRLDTQYIGEWSVKGDIKIIWQTAVGVLDQCVDCGVCFKVCPNKNHVELRNQLSWHQGWTTKKSERKKSSSGGFATALSKAFVKNGGIVCSCTFLEGDFVFKAVSTEEEVECFRGSKYVKSNPNINIDEALKNNHQLRHPAIMPPKREQFFKEIKKGRNYNAVIARIYPKICLKQKIKNMIFVFRNSKKMS